MQFLIRSARWTSAHLTRNGRTTLCELPIKGDAFALLDPRRHLEPVCPLCCELGTVNARTERPRPVAR